MPIPDYIMERIMRPIPPDCCVAPERWPTIANGDPGAAMVATVGLNPGGAFPGDKPNTPEEAWEGQKRYFRDHQPARYFDPLEGVLNACGASYGGKYDLDGSYAIPACNLDLVNWETDPRLWNHVPTEARNELLKKDEEFLATLLRENPNIVLLLGNGKTVTEELRRRQRGRIESVDTLAVPGYKRKMRVFVGEAADRRYIGWNYPLERIGTKMREKLAQRVGEIARGMLSP